MSKIFKKSLSVILAVALCLTAMLSCFTAYAAETTDDKATLKVTASSVDSAGKVTATITVSSVSETNLGALMLDVAVPSIPITAISATNTFELSTVPSISSGTIDGAESVRIMLLSKIVGRNYSKAEITITFDASAKALVESGIDPESGATLEVSVWGAQAACYGQITNSTEPENSVGVTIANDATVNAVGRAAATFTVVNTCSHNYNGVVTTAPTCTSLGVKTYTCADCGRVYTEEVDMLEHAYDSGVVVLEPTCAVTGKRVYTCADCGATKDEAIDATGIHTYPTVYEGNEDAWTVDEGNCTVIVYAHPNCLVCGATNMDASAAVEVGYGPHAWEVMEWTQEVSCTTDGIGYAMCWDCMSEDYEYTIPATGHTVSGEVTTVDPTCGTDGSSSYVCGNCGETVVETIPATGEHSYDDGVVTTAPTCTADGVKTYTCSGCGDTYTETVAATGSHSYDDGVVTTAPTCTEDGVKTYTCSACGDTYTEPVAATGSHSYNGVVTTAATCGKDGVKTYTCSACGDSYTEAIPATGEHSYDDGVVTTDPTCTTDGVKTYTCSVCGDSYTEAVAATGSHTESAAVYEDNATTGCYDAVVKCSACGEDITRIVTDIPNGTKVNSAIVPTTYVQITDSVGIMSMLTKSQLSSYSSYSIRYSRTAATEDGKYNIGMEYDETKEFEAYGSKRCYTVNKNIGMFEMALPLNVTVCGYDAKGNLVAVSAPYVTSVTREVWLLYSAATTDADKTFYVDLVNMGTDTQLYFAEQGGETCGLAATAHPNTMYAFNPDEATAKTPTYNGMPNSTSPSNKVTAGGKSCTLTKSVNFSTGATAIAYMITRGGSVANPELWSMDISYTDAYGKPQGKQPSGIASETNPDGITKYSTMVYYYYSPALYDSNKTVSTKIYYDGTLVFDDVYTIESYIEQTLPTLEEGSTFANMLSSLGKFGASARAKFGLS